MLASSTATVVDSSAPLVFANQDAQHVGMFGKIVIARAVSARDHAHGRQRAEFDGERRRDGGARRRGQLQARAARINRFAREQARTLRARERAERHVRSSPSRCRRSPANCTPPQCQAGPSRCRRRRYRRWNPPRLLRGNAPFQSEYRALWLRLRPAAETRRTHFVWRDPEMPDFAMISRICFRWR